MLIYLLRHARASVIDGDFYGAALSPQSIDACRRLAISGLIPQPDLLIASPFRRARVTAQPLGEHFGLEVTPDDGFGEWKLRTLNLSNEEHRREEAAGFADPNWVVAGGESLNGMWQRILEGIEDLRLRQAETVLVVTHGTVIHLLCAGAAGRAPSLEHLHNTAFLDYAVLECDDRGFRIVRDIVRPAE